jgi:hypothetical protein
MDHTPYCCTMLGWGLRARLDRAAGCGNHLPARNVVHAPDMRVRCSVVNTFMQASCV